jgi:hypothetical protein
VLLALAGRVWAVEPADPNLIPEARKLLDYLLEVQGKEILTGISGFGGGPQAVLHKTGREPAIYGTDIYGFHRENPKLYHNVVKGTVEQCHRWWLHKGGIVSLHYHWGMPGDPTNTAWGDKKRDERKRIDLAKVVTPGTEEHKNVISDLSVTADYLTQLADARVPVLWRPLHEIDGGWFWWTDRKTPENTAALWRLIFDYLVKERGIHNLIWVYNAAHVANAIRQDGTFEDNVAYRKRFYPGPKYVDMASIDTYANPKLGWGASWEDARRRAFDLMQLVAPGKPLAIGEDDVLLNPDIAQKEGPPWVYCLAWFSDCKKPGWMRHSFNHDHMLTLDELPPLTDRNVAPNARIEGPPDGAELKGPSVELSGVASDRNGNLKSVAIHALGGPWRNWFLRNDEEVAKLFPNTTRLGEAKLGADGRWTFTWKDAPAGFHNVVAFARDADGAVACSNAVRVAVGLEDLARGKPATASSTSKNGGPPAEAVDGDPTSMWWSDKAQPDPQWLAVDPGSVRDVGGVAVTWWKAYAKNTVVEISPDGQAWIDVADIRRKGNFHGDSDIFRFKPVRARHVRLKFTDPAVTWQSYTVFEFRIYGAIPGGKAARE